MNFISLTDPSKATLLLYIITQRPTFCSSCISCTHSIMCLQTQVRLSSSKLTFQKNQKLWISNQLLKDTPNTTPQHFWPKCLPLVPSYSYQTSESNHPRITGHFQDAAGYHRTALRDFKHFPASGCCHLGLFTSENHHLSHEIASFRRKEAQHWPCTGLSLLLKLFISRLFSSLVYQSMPHFHISTASSPRLLSAKLPLKPIPPQQVKPLCRSGSLLAVLRCKWLHSHSWAGVTGPHFCNPVNKGQTTKGESIFIVIKQDF